MGAPFPGLVPAEQPEVEALLSVFQALEPGEKRKHETVLAYWLSIRGQRDLPPLRDLDPLAISEAGPSSVLLELVGGGEDAEIRHLGERLGNGAEIERIADASRPSILASIAKKLSAVAISRNYLAFEDEFSLAGATTRCWVTLLPLSSAGAWVDYVYAFVTFEAVVGESAAEPLTVDEQTTMPPIEVLQLEESADEPALDPQPEATIEPDQAIESALEDMQTEQPGNGKENSKAAVVHDEPAVSRPAGFSFDSLTAAAGFYGTRAVKIEPTLPASAEISGEVALNAQPDEPQAVDDIDAAPVELPEPPAAEVAETSASGPIDQPPLELKDIAARDEPDPATPALEGTLQSKLTDVRAKADEARMAKLRSNSALYDGLSAAYDFALDAEDAPEEYLRLVEEKGLKIKLRSPMTPVVKLAFDGMCDDATLAQLEAVLAWALKQELPRGSLAQRIEEEGGIGPILNGLPKAA